MAAHPERAPLTVALIDEHILYRLGAARALEGERGLSLAWEAAGAAEARALLLASPVDVVVVGVDGRPGRIGVETVREIRAASPAAVVIVLGSALAGYAAIRLLDAGASAVADKAVAPEELIASIRALTAPPALEVEPPAGDRGRRRGRGARGPRLEHRLLSPREAEVLDHLGTGLTNREIASELGVSTTTVNKHVQRILHKLRVRNRVEAVALSS